MSQINQLAILTNPAEFEEAAKSGDRLTAKELALWQVIQTNQNRTS
jgi:hypothetical protein